MNLPSLTPEQELQARQIEEALLVRAQENIQQIARLMASRENHQLLGETEFQIRDLLHQIGNQAVETTLEVRKKRATPDAV